MICFIANQTLSAKPVAIVIKNFRFVIKDRLAGMGHPGMWSELEDSLIELRALGIGAIVSLDEYGLDESMLRKREFAYLHVPIEDFSTPTPEQVDKFVDFARDQIANDTGVVCHCFAGIGRTGTMLACYLVADGKTPDEAIRQVRNSPVPAIETLEQEYFIQQYAQHVQTRQAKPPES